MKWPLSLQVDSGPMIIEMACPICKKRSCTTWCLENPVVGGMASILWIDMAMFLEFLWGVPWIVTNMSWVVGHVAFMLNGPHPLCSAVSKEGVLTEKIRKWWTYVSSKIKNPSNDCFVTCIFFSNGLQGWCRNWLYGDASNLEAFFSKLIEKLRIEGRLKLEEQKDPKKEKNTSWNCQIVKQKTT